MGEIQVTTTDLYSASNSLNSTAIELGKLQVQLSEIIDEAGDAYEGQLRQALEDILDPGVQASGRLQNRAGELGRELFDRARAFEAANEAGRSATLKITTAYINNIKSTPSLGFFSIFRNKIVELGQSIWNIAGLGGLMSLFFVKTQPSLPSSFAPIPQPVPTPTPMVKINVTENPKRLTPENYLGFAESIPGDDNRRVYDEKQIQGVSDYGLYYRFDKSGGKSDCTWYAASAVEKAYGIPLNSGERGKSGAFSRSLGSGGEWAKNADDAKNNPNSKYREYKPYIKDVNRIPEPGSVYSVSSQNHVAFVENVTTVESNGKKQILVTLSEENYLHVGDKSFSGSNRIIVPNAPDVYRWQRELYFDVDPNTGEVMSDGKFIHFVNPN